MWLFVLKSEKRNSVIALSLVRKTQIPARVYSANLFFIPVLLILWFCVSSVVTAETLLLKDAKSQYIIGPYLETYADGSGHLEFRDVQSADFADEFIQSESINPNFGFTDSVYWARFSLLADFQEKKQWVLELRYPPLDSIEFFLIDGKGNLLEQKHTGDTFPFSQRDLDYHNFTFLIETLPQQQLTVYLRVDSESSVQFPLRLYSQESFSESISKEMVFSGVYYGIFVALGLYNLFLYLSVRERAYLYYVFYMFCMGLSQFSIHGYSYQYLWPENPGWANIIVLLLFSANMVFASLFTCSFLHSRINAPKLDKIIRYFVIPCYLSVAVLVVFGPYSLGAKLLTLLVNIAAPVFIAIGIQSWRHGFAPARFFVFAWVVLISFTLVWNAKHVGLVPTNWFTLYSVQIGSVIELLLLSLALGDRIKFERQERFRAQQLAVENLQKSNELKNSFMATISHELRTPMNGIIGSLELIEQADKNKESIETCLGTAESSAQHMQSLIEDILCFADSQTDSFVVVNEPFILSQVMTVTLDRYRKLCKAKQLTFTLECDEVFDLGLKGDAKHLLKVISHLLDNAVKFTSSGEVKLSIKQELEGVPEEGQIALRVHVEDTGIGIDQNKQAAVYDIFRQVDASFTRGHGGLGIGLAICHALVRAMEGAISFTSSTSGTCFDVLLFLRKATVEEQQELLKEASVSLVTTSSTRKEPAQIKNILVVEDNPVNQMILTNLITKLNLTVFKADNGEEAVDIFQRENIDFIFMDCQMPVMDGYEATKKIRKIDAKVPIIAVTANALERDRQRCFSVGMNDFISKPIKKGILAEMLNLWGGYSCSNDTAASQDENDKSLKSAG